jgi:hypothetical protein
MIASNENCMYFRRQYKRDRWGDLRYLWFLVCYFETQVKIIGATARGIVRRSPRQWSSYIAPIDGPFSVRASHSLALISDGCTARSCRSSMIAI